MTNVVGTSAITVRVYFRAMAELEKRNVEANRKWNLNGKWDGIFSLAFLSMIAVRLLPQALFMTRIIVQFVSCCYASYFEIVLLFDVMHNVYGMRRYARGPPNPTPRTQTSSFSCILNFRSDILDNEIHSLGLHFVSADSSLDASILSLSLETCTDFLKWYFISLLTCSACTFLD